LQFCAAGNIAKEPGPGIAVSKELGHRSIPEWVAVSDTGHLAVHDATLNTTAGRTL
jgi:hypothetical protein